MPELTKGQKVKVYQDPITCKDFEGTAKLVNFLGNNRSRPGRGVDQEYWSVEFGNDPHSYSRWVNVKKN